MKGYKFLTSKMKSANGNENPWEIGVWKEWKENIKLCEFGYHASQRPIDSLNYIYGDRWFEVEGDGKIILDEDKFVCSRMRIVRELPLKEIIVKFAIECEKHCLNIFEEKYPNDTRPRKTIKADELWLKNQNAVASAAAATVDAAARAVAYSVARVASTVAYSTATYAVERNWQNKKLIQIIERY